MNIKMSNLSATDSLSGGCSTKSGNTVESNNCDLLEDDLEKHREMLMREVNRAVMINAHSCQAVLEAQALIQMSNVLTAAVDYAPSPVLTLQDVTRTAAEHETQHETQLNTELNHARLSYIPKLRTFW